jgi:hypothetical protein
VPPLGHRGQVHVVVHADVRAEAFGQLGHQAGTPEAGQFDVVDGRGAAVVRAGHPDLDVPDAVRRRAGAGTHPGHHVHQSGHRIGTQEVHMRLVAGPDRAGQVTQRGHHRRRVGRADVAHRDGRGPGGVRVDGVDLGVRTGPAAVVADHRDQARLGEPPQHLGDGRRGELGEPAQVGAGQHARIEQVGQRRTLVHRAQQLR